MSKLINLKELDCGCTVSEGKRVGKACRSVDGPCLYVKPTDKAIRKKPIKVMGDIQYFLADYAASKPHILDDEYEGWLKDAVKELKKALNYLAKS